MFEQELNIYWKTVVDTLRDGVMIVDKGGTIVSVNKALETIIGYSSDELIGQPCSILNCDICEIARAEKGNYWCNLFKTGNFNMRKCTLQKRDGSYIHCLKNASLLYDVEGKVLGAVESVTDITEIIEKDNQIEAFRRDLRLEDSFHGLLGSSSHMQQVFDLITNAAKSDAPVIIFGESGTGKELVSRAIHTISDRKHKPFVKVSCAALTESLLESELFGHVKGAYTGAYRNREGRFETAHGGYIFLDEIGDMPLSVQVKLLRVLEEKIIERVGDNSPIPVDVRIITATNRDLKDMVNKGAFRKDLYFRINVIPIHLLPLRDRKDDIPLLTEFFFRKFRLKSGKSVTGIRNEAMELLVNYAWPGNVRELKSAFEYAFVTCQESMIHPDHLPPTINQLHNPQKSTLIAAKNREQMKRNELIAALEQARGNQSAAARILGVSRVTVWNRMKKFGIHFKRGIMTSASGV